MIDTVFQDHRLQHLLKNYLMNSPYSYRLRRLENCGCYCDITNGVHVISNGEQSRILGIRMCNSSWGCPVCTAYMMRKYSTRIGCAIDALAQQENLAAIMLTLTIFHTKEQSLQQTLDILTESYKSLTKNLYWRRKKANSDKYYQTSGTYQQFYKHFNITHSIKSIEITYGQHGWHPHYHILLFVPKNKLNEVLSWENSLLDYWRSIEDRMAKKILSPKQYEIRDLLSWKSDINRVSYIDGNKSGLYISKTKDNKVLQMCSGDYICGWGANNELTNSSNLKTANNGHYTILQLLEQGLLNNNQQLLDKYIEFMLEQTKRRLHKIDFSRTGINAIIALWKNTETYKETIKQKKIAIATKESTKPFHTVCWFSKSQWYNICFENDYNGVPLIPLIIAFSKYPDAFNLISELMIVNNLSPPLPHHPAKNLDWAEIFNNRFNEFINAA